MNDINDEVNVLCVEKEDFYVLKLMKYFKFYLIN